MVWVVRLSVSTMIGLVPSIVIDKLDPIVGLLELINSKPGFFISESPVSPIVKSHISEVGQNLFFRARRILRLSYLSPSKNKTVSTICSNVFGPANAQSLLICPIINTQVSVVFA